MKRIASLFVILSLFLSGCNMFQTDSENIAEQATVSGTVNYLTREALPEGAIITVTLADTSRADAPATTIDEVMIPAEGNQVPIPFELTYNPTQIDERYTYTVRAKITLDDELIKTSTQAYPVITRDNPTDNIVIMVENVQ
ncbi:MAG TPA: YbaY family lipoprotein [Candidatus Gracilibacteria bacterium]|nr:YbaY family lipoprotein [Candidatus Gracilibacteria bacterium]